tara:strand:- start:256 stop:507 length:252 start_codon:yes stop_codon:yes gene_type:complete
LAADGLNGVGVGGPDGLGALLVAFASNMATTNIVINAPARKTTEKITRQRFVKNEVKDDLELPVVSPSKDSDKARGGLLPSSV